MTMKSNFWRWGMQWSVFTKKMMITQAGKYCQLFFFVSMFWTWVLAPGEAESPWSQQIFIMTRGRKAVRVWSLGLEGHQPASTIECLSVLHHQHCYFTWWVWCEKWAGCFLAAGGGQCGCSWGVPGAVSWYKTQRAPLPSLSCCRVVQAVESQQNVACGRSSSQIHQHFTEFSMNHPTRHYINMYITWHWHDNVWFDLKAPVLLLCLLLALGGAQNTRRQNNRNRPNRQNRPVRQNRQGQFLRNGVTRNGSKDKKGTEVYPGCSGKVCLPEAQLCAERQRKVSVVGVWAVSCELWTSSAILTVFIIEMVAGWGLTWLTSPAQTRSNV